MNKQGLTTFRGSLNDSGYAVSTTILLSGLTVVLLGLVSVFVFYSSHGFDITDESFYLLWARQPDRVLASSTQFGFYTRLLYLLSGENIALFRMSGVVALLGATAFFSFSLKRYWMSLADISPANFVGWQESLLILNASLVYYASWLITPSYNWLALVSTTLCGAGLLRFTSLVGQDKREKTGELWSIANALLVGASGGLAFMAKPTTAFVLALVTLFWILVHRQENRKKFLGTALVSAGALILFHAVVFNGGILYFYKELSDGVRLAGMLGAGHSVAKIFSQAFKDVQAVPTFILSLFDRWWLVVLSVAFCALSWNVRHNRLVSSLCLLTSVLLSFFGMIWFHLWERDYWSRSLMGWSGVALLSVLLACALFVKLSWRKKQGKISMLPFRALVGLCFFIVMLAISYAFGSANGLVRQMSGAYVFFVSGAVYIAFWMDLYIERNIFRNFVSVAVIASVLVVLNKGIEKPYRLLSRLSDQNEAVSLLSGRGYLKVDHSTAEYINKLKQIARKVDWIPGTTLIDLTGGSPGATLILDAKIVGFPWLAGGYKGSRAFVTSVLELVPEEERCSAWVLTAPQGRRMNTTDILLDLNLKFPDNYKAVGKVRTGHRNELQVLWKPDQGTAFE